MLSCCFFSSLSFILVCEFHLRENQNRFSVRSSSLLSLSSLIAQKPQSSLFFPLNFPSANSLSRVFILLSVCCSASDRKLVELASKLLQIEVATRKPNFSAREELWMLNRGLLVFLLLLSATNLLFYHDLV